MQVYTELYRAVHSFGGRYTTIQSYAGLYRAVQNYTKLFGWMNIPNCVLNLLVLFGGTSF